MAEKLNALYAFKIAFLLGFFSLVMPGCATPYYYRLSSGELARLKLEAVRGDGKAAGRISDYYSFTKSDHNNEFIWTLIGAENGDTYSMDVLTAFYVGVFGEDKENFTRAIFWLYQLAIYDYEDTSNYYWRSETFIKRLESDGYTLETAKPPSDSLFPNITLDPNSIARYQEGALQGSGQAALVLAKHASAAGDAEEAEYWYRIGAQNGNSECMRQYGGLLLGKTEMLDQERGKFWLARQD